MKTFFKITKGIAVIALMLFVSFVIYANWSEPPLSEKLDIKPINLAVYNIKQSINQTDSTLLANSLAENKAITASTINTQSKTISITYHPDEATESDLEKIIEASKIKIARIDFSKFEGPQCPVPTEYIDFILGAKKALCFR